MVSQLDLKDKALEAVDCLEEQADGTYLHIKARVPDFAWLHATFYLQEG